MRQKEESGRLEGPHWASWRLGRVFLFIMLFGFFALPLEAQEDALPPTDKEGGVFRQKKGLETYDTQELMERIRFLQDQEAAGGTSYEAPVTIFLDDRHVADVLAIINHSGKPPRLKYRDVVKLLGQQLGHDLLVELGELQDFRGWVSIDGLEAYSPIFNDQLLNLHLTTPPELRTGGKLDLAGAFPFDPNDAIGPEPCSAYLTMYNQLNYDNKDFHYVLNLEPAFRSAPWVFEGRFEIDTSRPQIFDFNNIRFFKDWPEDLRRLTVGETQSFRPRLLASDRIYGVKYSTEFEMQPTLVTEPISEYSFLLQRDSTVEVWVNGRLQQTLRLRSGPYDLINFPLLIGANNVVLRITDDLGREQTLSFDTVKGPSLLGAGTKEFAYSLGFRGRGKEVEGGPLIGVSARCGITDQFSSSYELRGDSEHLAAAVGGDFATRYFYGTFDIGASLTPCVEGWAVRLILSRYFECVSLGFRCDYRDENYLEQEQDLSSERLKSLHELSVIFPRFSTLGSVRIHALRTDRWQGDKEQREDVEWDYTINDRWAFRVALGYSHYVQPKSDRFQASFRLTFNSFNDEFRRRHEAFVDRENISFFNTLGGNPTRMLGDWTLDHSRFIDEDGDATDNVRGTFRYRAPRFHVYYSGEVGDYGDDNDIHQSIDFNTALVYTPHAWSIGPPVLNSFAIIKPDEKLKDMVMRAYSGGERGKATPCLPAVISNLRPFYPSIITVEAEHSTMWLEFEPFMVYPHERSGILLTVSNPEGEGFGNSVHGTIVDIDGNPVIFQALRVDNLTEPSEPVISFTSETGKFRVGGIQAGHKYRVYVGYLVDIAMYEGQEYYLFTVKTDQEEPFSLDVGELRPIRIGSGTGPRMDLPRWTSRLKKKETKLDILTRLLRQMHFFRTGRIERPGMYPAPYREVAIVPRSRYPKRTKPQESVDEAGGEEVVSGEEENLDTSEEGSFFQTIIREIRVITGWDGDEETEEAAEEEEEGDTTLGDLTVEPQDEEESIEQLPPKPTERVEIRPVKEADAEALNDLRRHAGFGGFSRGLQAERVTQTQQFLKGLTDYDHVLVVEEETGAGIRLVGMGGLYLSRDPRTRHCGVLELMIHDDYKQQGADEQLLKGLLDLADNWLNVGRLELEVVSDNELALELVQQNGFVVEGQRKCAIVRDGEYKDITYLGRCRIGGKCLPTDVAEEQPSPNEEGDDSQVADEATEEEDPAG